MNYKLVDIIDIPLLQSLQEKLNVIYSFPSAIVDNDGKVITAVAWQDICTKFHRIHPECEKECIKSDLYILEHLHEANSAVSYTCPHGLVDNATPIVIDGKHLGNFFTGQFFLEKPDLEFFKKQAKKYGFDEKAYLEAVEKVPIWTKKKLAQYLDFIKGFIEIIAGLGLNNLKEIELNKQLKETEERQQAIINSTSDWIWEIDINGRYTYCSNKVEQILGYSVYEIIGKTPFDLMPQDERERVGAIFQNIVETKNSIINIENWNIHKDGHRVCLLTNGFPVYDENGKIKGYRGADKDITERKKNEEIIQEKNEFLIKIIESLTHPFYVIDAKDYTIKMANSASGLNIDSKSIKCHSLTHKSDSPCQSSKHPCPLEIVKETKKTTTVEHIHFDEHGNPRDIEVHGYPIFDNDNNVVQMIEYSLDITERKLAENKLKSSEDLFSLFMHHSPIYTYIKEVSSTESRVIQASENFIEMIGISGTNMIGKKMEELFPMEFAAKISADDWDVVLKGNVLEIDEDLNGRNYTTIKFPITHGDKKLLAGYTIDITEQKIAEKALIDSEDRFKDLVEMLPVAVFEMNPEFYITYANQYAFDLFGYNEDDLAKGLNGFDMLAPEEKERTMANFALRLKGENPGVVEYQGLKKDGTKLTVYFHANTIYKDGKLTGIRGVIVDITEQKKAEQAVKESEEKFRELANFLPQVVYEVDLKGNLTFSNKQAFRTFGYSQEDFDKGINVFQIIVAEDRERGMKNIQDILKGIEPANHEYMAIRKGGSIFPVLIYSSAIYKNDSPVGLRGIIVDITQQKLTEKELIKAKEKSEESDRLKSAFLSNMSHEIRTPMNGILGFTNLLKEKGLTGEEQKEYINIIQKSGERMLNTINDIMDISKIESGQVNISISEVNVNEQTVSLYKFFKPEVEKKGMEIYLKNSLPANDSIIKTDLEKFYSILTNLIKNATKYSHKGIIEFGYKIMDINNCEHLQFYVKDTGIGIQKDRLQAIFERFVQADIEDKAVYEGSGLGLAISKAFVEMLGGKIWVESEEGVGSTFYFTLPYSTDEKKRIESDPDSHWGYRNRKQEHLLDPQNQKLKILIAEDEEYADMHLSILLKNIGKEILHAKTGIEAIEIFQKNPDIDLILMDIKMPKMSGYEATRQIREFNREVTIIAQTAYALEGDREKAIEAGCDDYLTKPIISDALLSLIQKYFKK